MISKFLAISILFFCLSCENKDNLPPIPTEQFVLFQYSHVNHAWGYINKGWLIDHEGNVLKYNVDNNANWHFSEKGFLSNTEMIENLSHAELTEIRVSEEELQEMFSLIEEAKKGEISEAKNIGADMGAIVFSGYDFSADSNKYEQVFLSQSGDFERENKHKKAQKLVKWLKEINDQIN
ncbi:hypothetical protein [Flexithrix dorotheae]|uniref:hypothetical protein n=1 Tax=Flexithrix dorotheae TaxID=70993 RepID=UPI0012F8CF05|nr:hypothetical protein [Flexithrix dorotheae]